MTLIAETDSFLELETSLRGILRAHGIDRPLAVHDTAKRLTREGFRLSEVAKRERCRGNAQIKGCGEMAVLSQGVCLHCLTRHNRSELSRRLP